MSSGPILKRMKEMRLASISFRPPATILDAVDYFRQASRDYDRPDIPFDMRGFNIVLKMENEINTSKVSIPQIPKVTATAISFYDALTMICKVVGYRFVIANGSIVVLPKNMALNELPTKCFDIDDEKLCEIVSDWAFYNQERKGDFGFEEGDDIEEESFWGDVLRFMKDYGVQWAPGSHLRYLSSTRQLRVTNVAEELEKIRDLLRECRILVESN
jgi:hypothetical protein